MAALSIIMPVLNEASGIAGVLAALADFRRRGAEIIVVDGGSRDATIERARSGADQILSAPRGRALQMNAGAAAASGDVLLFLHADTKLPPNADKLVCDGLTATSQSWGRFDVIIAGCSPMLGLIATMMNLRSRLSGIATGDQAIFVTRDAFQAAGGFPAIPLMEDIALSKALKRRSPPLCLRARVTTSGRRWDTNGVVGTILLMWRLRLAYFLGADPARLARQYGSGRG